MTDSGPPEMRRYENVVVDGRMLLPKLSRVALARPVPDASGKETLTFAAWQALQNARPCRAAQRFPSPFPFKR